MKTGPTLSIIGAALMAFEFAYSFGKSISVGYANFTLFLVGLTLTILGVTITNGWWKKSALEMSLDASSWLIVLGGLAAIGGFVGLLASVKIWAVALALGVLSVIWGINIGEKRK